MFHGLATWVRELPDWLICYLLAVAIFDLTRDLVGLAKGVGR